MTASAGHPTLRLVRVQIGDLALGGLKPGEMRTLGVAEVNTLCGNPRKPPAPAAPAKVRHNQAGGTAGKACDPSPLSVQALFPARGSRRSSVASSGSENLRQADGGVNPPGEESRQVPSTRKSSKMRFRPMPAS